MQDAKQKVQSLRCTEKIVEHQRLSVRHKVSEIQNKVQDARHKIRGTKHKVRVAKHWALGIEREDMEREDSSSWLVDSVWARLDVCECVCESVYGGAEAFASART